MRRALDRTWAREYAQRPRAPLALDEGAPYVRCVVPGCIVRTRRPTKFGTCPVELWDERHERYAARRAVEGAA